MTTDKDELRRLVSSDPLTRRDFMKGAAVLGGGVAMGSVLAACGEEETTTDGGAGEPKKGGSLRVGIVGGSAKDTADPGMAGFEPDIAIQYCMYDGLTAFDQDYQLVNHLAEEVTPNADGSVYTVRLKPDLTWHDGKPVTADDVVYTFDRILDPDMLLNGAATLTGLTPGNTVKIDDLTVEFRLDASNVLLPEALAFRGNQLVPVDFDPNSPVGCGPFVLDSFKPGEQFTFTPFAEYWGGSPWVDDLSIIEFADETARVNALSSGEVEAISQLPTTQAKVIEGTSGLALLNAETGGWRPFTMRIDVTPYSDIRVRQAFRLIVDRQQMIDQAYAGFGSLGNDMYAPFDPGTPDLAQRAQDLEQAKALLKEAGYEDLTVELVTSSGALGADEVAAAQVFAEQAKGAGVTVNIKKVDAGVFYGEDYLSWDFAQDFWYTRNFLSQCGQSMMPGSPYNETHWENADWLAIVNEAFRTVDETKRNELISEAQTILHDEGGYIIWAFRNQVDAYSAKIAGLKPDKSGVPLGQFGFKDVYFV
ncbi:MAG: twin-arginine translocation signal domain-containing protein [Thermoleophilia bacterium]|nr:twin-arginine translocation signal domain-containing protein [Thermoleophilia bacterium]